MFRLAVRSASSLSVGLREIHTSPVALMARKVTTTKSVAAAEKSKEEEGEEKSGVDITGKLVSAAEGELKPTSIGLLTRFKMWLHEKQVGKLFPNDWNKEEFLKGAELSFRVVHESLEEKRLDELGELVSESFKERLVKGADFSPMTEFFKSVQDADQTKGENQSKGNSEGSSEETVSMDIIESKFAVDTRLEKVLSCQIINEDFRGVKKPIANGEPGAELQTASFLVDVEFLSQHKVVPSGAGWGADGKARQQLRRQVWRFRAKMFEMEVGGGAFAEMQPKVEKSLDWRITSLREAHFFEVAVDEAVKALEDSQKAAADAKTKKKDD